MKVEELFRLAYIVRLVVRIKRQYNEENVFTVPHSQAVLVTFLSRTLLFTPLIKYSNATASMNNPSPIKHFLAAKVTPISQYKSTELS